MSCAFAYGAVLYSSTLYQWVDGDEIVALESEKALHDDTYAERDVIGLMGYRTYLFPKLVTILNDIAPLPAYKTYVLFFIVASTIFCAYVALVWLRFPRWLAFTVAIVAIFPRFAPVGETFGALTPYEIQGRNLAVPMYWLFSAWFINRFTANKRMWPVFLVLGFVSYVHPATMIMFFGLLLLAHLGMTLSAGKWLVALKHFGTHILAFSIGAFFLLYEIVTRTHGIASPASDLVVSTKDYVHALQFRIPWEYPPHSVAWLRHVLIVGGIFFISSLYVLWRMRKGDIKKDSRLEVIITWSAWVLVLSFIIHLFVPITQLFLIEHFDAPLVLWQFGRIFKFTYLALLLMFAVAVYLLHKRYQKRWITTLMLMMGVASSSFAFEWFQFLIGYPNYQKEYIPAVLQEKELPNQYTYYQRLCTQLHEAGAQKGDVVLINDFNIRYFCGLRPHTSFEEGTAYIFMGKGPLVAWHKDMLRQTEVLKGDDVDAVVVYAEEVGARFVALPSSSPATRALIERGSPAFQKGDTTFILLQTQDDKTES